MKFSFFKNEKIEDLKALVIQKINKKIEDNGLQSKTMMENTVQQIIKRLIDTETRSLIPNNIYLKKNKI